MSITSRLIGPICICICMYSIKLFAFELATKFSRRGQTRSTTFVQHEKRNFQTTQNGGFPSLAIFAKSHVHNTMLPAKSHVHNTMLPAKSRLFSMSRVCTHTYMHTNIPDQLGKPSQFSTLTNTYMYTNTYNTYMYTKTYISSAH
jgi:hypothetical protein